jgi:lambda repressor-like predicted transcriptional regulator
VKWAEIAHMAVHRGQILDNAIREKGITFAAAAKRCKISRRTLYNYLENPELPWQKIIEFEENLQLDLGKYFTQLRKYKSVHSEPLILKEPQEAVYWRNKYIELLERYALHLEAR